MSNHRKLRDLRSEVVHFKNKYKFMIIKTTTTPQINEAFVGFHRKYKSALQYPFGFCSDISFTRKIFSRNWHLIFARI